jgi:hypothetical protein
MGGMTEHHPDIVQMILFIQTVIPTKMRAEFLQLIKKVVLICIPCSTSR